jgi:multisubunit Na+/H+ antiporter MnhF subunit
MPPWMELLLNVIAFAGFIAIAKYHKSRGGNSPDR